MSNGGSEAAEERRAWIALASTPGVGDITFARLLEAYGSASNALQSIARLPLGSADNKLAQALGMRKRKDLALAIRHSASDPGIASRAMNRLEGWILTPLDPAYPARLHAVEEPPAVLYGIGDAQQLGTSRMVAVVGTRRPSAAGRDLAMRVVTRLCEAGVVVVSGLALGIDGSAHLASLDAGGFTVAVVGSGLDAPGPVRHRGLASAIMRRGAVVGELAPGVSPTPGTFPRRNRIISALATATIIIEAPKRSGALITARHALEQGRTVLVAPGSPMDPRVAGNLRLLRESPAKPLVGMDEMLIDLGLDGGPVTGTAAGSQLSAAGAIDLLGPQEAAVARALVAGPATVDALVRSTALPPGVVAGVLTILQVRGWARVHGAMQLPAGPLLSDATEVPVAPDHSAQVQAADASVG